MSATSGSLLTVRDAWVKAVDSGMTGVFAVLVNDGDTDLTVVSAMSSVSPVELHEMAMKDGAMVMRPKTGGFTVKARSTYTLQPGGDHLMLMNLAKPIRPGDVVTVTLTFTDGRSAEFTAIAKPFAGGAETYAPNSHASHMP